MLLVWASSPLVPLLIDSSAAAWLTVHEAGIQVLRDRPWWLTSATTAFSTACTLYFSNNEMNVISSDISNCSYFQGCPFFLECPSPLSPGSCLSLWNQSSSMKPSLTSLDHFVTFLCCLPSWSLLHCMVIDRFYTLKELTDFSTSFLLSSSLIELGFAADRHSVMKVISWESDWISSLLLFLCVSPL